MSESLLLKAKRLPNAPGVYIFKDSEGRVIYIGKAKSLKKRVQSHFRSFLSQKSQAMVSKIADIAYRKTISEAGAQILEARLVKQVQPLYNVSLKDDKSFPFIKITAEDFPVVSLCRRRKARVGDKGKYYGPYTNARLLRQSLTTIRKLFGFRSCRSMPAKACLYYRLNLCPAPCIGEISRREYHKRIYAIQLFLEYNYTQLISSLSRQMKKAASCQDFERAGQLRDQIKSLELMQQTNAEKTRPNALEDLKEHLHLTRVPLWIEAFDISNISGSLATGSMVSFYKGSAYKAGYRHFRVKTVTMINDYSMLREIIRRRYKRLLREHLALPDLVIIDGGKGHLHAALEEMKHLEMNVPVISIAKETNTIYAKDTQPPLKLKDDSPALHLIWRIRDEAHRFALRYHQLLRAKKLRH